MDYYETSFFLKEDGHARISYSNEWPRNIRINSSGIPHNHPCITIFIETEAQFIEFKNSVIQAYESYRRKRNAS